MSKNVVIFSDGTGQRSGVLFDESRSNIYKLYRATRCGPDSQIDPREQLAFYDPGIGTLPAGIGMFAAAWHSLYNLVSQATGLGLTRNIVHCYAAVLEMWRPGDRILLFGFSRGAYTVRCLAGVIALCGIPTRMADGSPLLRDQGTCNRIARKAVKCVYQHTNSRTNEQATPRQREFIDQRRALARQFRESHGSGNEDKANAYPHFIGVFDTVASLSQPDAILLLSFAAALGLILISLALSLVGISFWKSAAIVLGAAAIGVAIGYLASHIKVAFKLPGYPWYRTLHLAEPRMKFYDRELNPDVGSARHAISIDERRSLFPRVPWGSRTANRATEEANPEWLKQVWFAGNHADVGGGYRENESRLSDVSLAWMSEEARQAGLKFDPSVLRLYPSAGGMQHDECMSGIFRLTGTQDRDPPRDAPLHETVFERFALAEVLQYNQMRPYRPACLRAHGGLEQYYR